jgi:hypothetical protein
MEKKMDRNTLKALLLCAGKTDVRLDLNSVWFEPGIAYATDGHRLLVVKDESIVSSGYIPRDTVEKMIKIADRDAEMQFGEKCVSMSGITCELKLDHTAVNWRAISPRNPSGEVAQFNFEYLTDFGKAARLLGTSHSQFSIGHNGTSAALIGINDQAFGVLMPMRMTTPTFPDWAIEQEAKQEEALAA